MKHKQAAVIEKEEMRLAGDEKKTYYAKKRLHEKKVKSRLDTIINNNNKSKL